MIKLLTNTVERQAFKKQAQHILFLERVKEVVIAKKRYSIMVMLSVDVDKELRLRLYQRGKHNDSHCYALGNITEDSDCSLIYNHMVTALCHKVPHNIM